MTARETPRRLLAIRCLFLAALLSVPVTAAGAQASGPPTDSPTAGGGTRTARPMPTLVLSLSAVMLEGSGWTEQRVVETVRGAGRILAPCGVELDRMEFSSLVVPESYLEFNRTTARDLVRDYRVENPAVYFVRPSRRNPGADGESFSRSGSKSEPGLVNTIWITGAAREPHVALARGLVHVLANSDVHSGGAGNLMRDGASPQGTALTTAQCARLRRAATEGKLLKISR